MLGWMLKRGENAPHADDGDQPDTPAPVFAARAFKSALFGTPSKRNEERRVFRSAASRKPTSRSSETPSKPQGILLTPGIGTSKRKRVSFGHDVPGGSMTDLAKTSEQDLPTEARQPTAPTKSLAKLTESQSRVAPPEPAVSDDEWEEEEDCGAHDVTLDLNEPHSQSGRYWKEEFLRYHQEAKAEMEKLLKYKQLAKSYAQRKDAEAIELAERLRDEQQRVIKMEKRIAENAAQIAAQRKEQPAEAQAEMLTKLTKQSSLAAQYRHRVQELEAQMGELLTQRENGAGVETPRRRYASTPSVTATQKTLTETRRELRRARSQLKELDALRDEVFSLKTQLKKAELKLVVIEKEEALTSNGPRARELRALLKAAKEDSRRKEDEIRLLKNEYEAFRKENEVHEADTRAVLERAHNKIADLKNEVKALRSAGTGPARPHSWHPRSIGEEKIKESKSDEPIRVKVETAKRRSSDEPLDMAKNSSQPRTLREKFVDDAALAPKSEPLKVAGRASLGKAQWQPFVPRSPRHRIYAAEDGVNRLTQSNKPKEIAVPELPPNGSTSAAEPHIDLLSRRFARLGGPGPNAQINSSLVANTSRRTLPPERRAAALARIEKRMAEKKRLRDRSGGHDKENVRP
ncbi:Spindle-body formation-associated protein [Metarhizium album ARSEF 1941]|uniref:Spindle-body formation-associated protein n=1 Tax=Metarhizium album (strain ARSEF 1941) TaxID=1081103 RepID=A0A0B2X4I0_METAS|nr:Spindle-body formation-associated protein [Metarhizium album ARSEF 1941]KHO00335.1 Spindle-body formation-associated protein [Metarhizium album ARSEF 1941]